MVRISADATTVDMTTAPSRSTVHIGPSIRLEYHGKADNLPDIISPQDISKGKKDSPDSPTVMSNAQGMTDLNRYPQPVR
ncbi:MAG: hypothetical protein LUC18_00750 [Porphyromonadaceae bacterium]|nr:hypothetical protein [Porphyromonadaceae bacterium]